MKFLRRSISIIFRPDTVISKKKKKKKEEEAVYIFPPCIRM